jgi:hypothetical protein
MPSTVNPLFQVFVRCSVPRQIEYCREIARVTSLSILSEEVYLRAARAIEPVYTLAQVKDLALWHVRDLRERRLQVEHSDKCLVI